MAAPRSLGRRGDAGALRRVVLGRARGIVVGAWRLGLVLAAQRQTGWHAGVGGRAGDIGAVGDIAHLAHVGAATRASFEADLAQPPPPFGPQLVHTFLVDPTPD